MKTSLKFAISFMVIWMICFSGSAQTNYEDVVYLKNGSIIHGIIIEQIPNQSLKIQTKDRNVFVFRFDEITKITKEEIPGWETKNQFGNTGRKESGFTNITELNFAFGTGRFNNEASFGIQTINGYQFNPHFSLGFGIGVDKYKNETFLPLFADIRINFLRSDVTPYFAAGTGYSMGFDGNKGGFLFNPSFGIKFFVDPKAALNFSVGYRLQENSVEVPYYFQYYPSIYTYKESLHFINIKFGATF